MKGELLYLVIVPNRVDGALMRGTQIVGSHRAEVPGVRWDELWGGDLAPLDEAIAQIVRTLRVRAGTETVVAYSAPKSTVEVFAVPGTGRAAIQAASLSLREAMGSTNEFGAVGIDVLWSSGSRASARAMVLGAGEPDATPESICALLGRSGLTPRSLVPTRAIAVQTCWAQAERRSEQDVVLIELDEDCMTMVGIVGGEPRMVRQCALGIELFVEAYTRAMRATRSDSVGPPTREEAAQAFWTHGIPSREASIDRDGKTRGHDVLPLLQPIVQRLAIEIKQTLRFGLDADGRRLPIFLIGRSASVTALAALLTDHADCPIDAEPPPQSVGNPWGPVSAVERVAAGIPRAINLLPRSVAERGSARTVRRAALAGAGLAALLIVAESTLTMSSLKDVRAELDAARPEVAMLRDQAGMKSDAARIGRVVAEAERRLSESIGARPAWMGLLASVESASGRGVHLSDIACGEEQGAPVATLRGFSEAVNDSSESLRQFIASLEAAPSVERVTLGSTRLQEFEGRQARAFTIVVHLRDGETVVTVTGESK